jgi:hypothetical protein
VKFSEVDGSPNPDRTDGNYGSKSVPRLKMAEIFGAKLIRCQIKRPEQLGWAKTFAFLKPYADGTKG